MSKLFRLPHGEVSKRARKAGISNTAMHMRLRVQHGLCSTCGAPRDPGREEKVLCLRCTREQARRYHDKQRRNGKRARVNRCRGCQKLGHNSRTCPEVTSSSA